MQMEKVAERFYYERPSAARKAEIIEYLNEFAAAGSEIKVSGSLDRILSGWTFEQALERCLSMENKEYAEKMNRCPGKTFLLIREDDNRIVGTVNVRWDLNEEMLRFGGHIGYEIRPSERRKGYNKINLYLALKEAKKIGLDRVMIDCAVSNIASDKTIQALGGILERCEKDPADDEMTNVYWINVEEALSELKAVYEPYISASAMAIQELTLKDLQPSQFYISEKKLHDIEVWLNPEDLSGFEPIPVKILDGVSVMTDGHTRAVAALRAGLTTVPLAADEDDLDWEMYRRCVQECRKRDIFSPADLLGRIIPESEYDEKWNQWCDRMQAEVIRDRIVIKEQDLDDALSDILIRLSTDWEAENSCYGYRKNEKADIEGNRIFIAKDGEDIIGYLFGYLEKSERSTSIMPDGTPVFEVEELYVKPEYRSKGIGKMLFAYTESAVRNEADYIMLSTATKNWRAIFHFYLDELGMEFWSARLFKKVTHDETVVLMSRKDT